MENVYNTNDTDDKGYGLKESKTLTIMSSFQLFLGSNAIENILKFLSANKILYYEVYYLRQNNDNRTKNKSNRLKVVIHLTLENHSFCLQYFQNMSDIHSKFENPQRYGIARN